MMAWRGLEGDEGLYYSFFKDGIGWEAQKRAPPSSADSPALTTYKGRVMMAWRGVEGDGGLYYSFYDDVQGLWTPQRRAPGSSDIGPSITTYSLLDENKVMQEKVMMVWKGVNDDPGIYYSVYDELQDRWNPQNRIASDIGSWVRPVVCAYNDNVLLFWLESGLWMRFAFFDNGAWLRRQDDIPGITTGDLEAGLDFFAATVFNGDIMLVYTRMAVAGMYYSLSSKRSNQLVDGIVASSAIPGIFRHKNINGSNFCDGGIRHVVPIKPAIDLGAREIYAVNPSSPMLPEKISGKGFLELFERAVNIMIDQISNIDTHPYFTWPAPVLIIIEPTFDK
jgi:hypothetical protein